MAQQDNPNLTITLTGRRPVTISKADWPVVASASDHQWEGAYEVQSFRHWRYRLTVRQHADGRAIIYGVYDYTTSYQGEEEETIRRGDIIPSDGADGIPAAVLALAREIAEAITDEARSERMILLAHECIADMPAEVL